MRKIFTRELVAVIVTVGLASLAMSLLQPILPLYLTSLGVNPTLLGLMFSAGMAGMVLGESSGGWLADRVGIKVPLLIGTLMCAPLVLSFVFVTNPAMIFVVFFIWGVVRAAIFGPGRGYIRTRIPFSQKATVMAVYGASMAAFRGLGALASGFLVDIRGYDWVFYAATGVGLAAGLLVLVSVNRSTDNVSLGIEGLPSNDASPAGLARGRAVPFYRHRQFIAQSAIALLYFAAIGLGPFLSLLARDVAGLPISQVGIVFTIGAVVNAVMLIPMGRLADRTSKRTMMIAGLLITATGQAIVGFSHGFSQIAAGMIVQSAGGAMFGPAAVSLLSEHIPLQRQSTAMGIYGGCEDIGVIVGSAMGGVIWTAFGPTSTFLIMGTASAVIGAILAMILLKDPDRTRPGDGRMAAG